jgi:hypothetical protein
MNNSRATTSFLLGGLLALALAFLWLLGVASSSWTKGVAEAIDEARARDPRRPVMRGEAVPGRAWAEYEQGLAAVRGVAVDDVNRWLEGAAADRAKAGAILAANEKALGFLRAGARKAEGGYPIQWERGASASVPALIDVRNLTTLAVGQARVLVEAGKPREAAELLLDAAQFGADLGQNAILLTELTALSVLCQVFDGLRRLPPDPEVGKALAVLDATFPNHADAVQNDVALLGVSFVRMEQAFDPSAWRFGFSQRLMTVDAWPTVEDMVRRMAATTTAPWAEAERVTAAIAADAKGSHNPIVQTIIPGLVRSQSASRERRAHLRMLRVLHGGAAGLDDPFGGKILSDGGKVWSVGADGIDGGGAGAWKPAPTGDIVLELPAR